MIPTIGNKILNKETDNGVLFIKTNSVESDWFINQIETTESIRYRMIDNTNGNIIKDGYFGSYSKSLTVDLSASNGDNWLYLFVDETGNGISQFNNWNGGKFYWIDFNVIPLITSLRMYMYRTVTVAGSDLLHLEYFLSYTNYYIGLDFSQTTKLTYIRFYGSPTVDIPIDISNNHGLLTFSISISSIFDAMNVDFSDFPLLGAISYYSATSTELDPYINNDFMSDLRSVNVTNSIPYVMDYIIRNLVNLTYHQINTNGQNGFELLVNLTSLTYSEYGTDLLSVDTFTNLTTLVVLECHNTTLSLNLATSLKSISINYSRQPNLTTIYINNGLNSQVTKFESKYQTPGDIKDVVVDNAIDANNEVDPYFPTVWVKQYNGNDTLNWI